MASVIPNSGYIRIHDVLHAIDACIDELLQMIRRLNTYSDGNNNGQQQQQQQQRDEEEEDDHMEEATADDTAENVNDTVGDNTSANTPANPAATSNATTQQPPQKQRKQQQQQYQYHYHQVIGIGFSTFVMNLVGVDVYGEPVDELATLSYACNREDVVWQCRRLRDKLGPQKLQAMYQRTGAPLHPSYALPQLLAFYANPHARPLAKKIERWQSISSVCLHRWTGKPNLQMPVSYSEASWTGMLDFRRCTWDEEAVHLFENCRGIVQYAHDMEDDDEIDLLPPLVDYDAALPFLFGVPRANEGVEGGDNPYWERWPELRSATTAGAGSDGCSRGRGGGGLNLFLGVGDGAAANVGSKCGRNSITKMNGGDSDNAYRVAVTIGTSAAARVCLPFQLQDETTTTTAASQRDVSIPPGLFCYRVDRDHILVGGALTDGGSVVEWARSLLNLQTDKDFHACLARVSEMYREHCASTSATGIPTPPPSNGGVTMIPPPSSSNGGGVAMIPFLSGERSTGFRGGAKACISGLTRETTPAHILYACLESVILRLGRVLTLVNEACGGSQSSKEGQKKNSRKGIIVASGNALGRNPLWRQMLADCSSMDVVVDADSSSEGSSRGVAMMMAGSLYQRALRDPRSTFRFEEPLAAAHEARANAEGARRWRSALSAQESLIDAVSTTWNDV